MKKQIMKCNGKVCVTIANAASDNIINKKELTEKEQIKYLLEVAEAGKKVGRTVVKGERAKLKALGILED